MAPTVQVSTADRTDNNNLLSIFAKLPELVGNDMMIAFLSQKVNDNFVTFQNNYFYRMILFMIKTQDTFFERKIRKK